MQRFLIGYLSQCLPLCPFLINLLFFKCKAKKKEKKKSNGIEFLWERVTRCRDECDLCAVSLAIRTQRYAFNVIAKCRFLFEIYDRLLQFYTIQTETDTDCSIFYRTANLFHIQFVNAHNASIQLIFFFFYVH